MACQKTRKKPVFPPCDNRKKEIFDNKTPCHFFAKLEILLLSMSSVEIGTNQRNRIILGLFRTTIPLKFCRNKRNLLECHLHEFSFLIAVKICSLNCRFQKYSSGGKPAIRNIKKPSWFGSFCHTKSFFANRLHFSAIGICNSCIKWLSLEDTGVARIFLPKSSRPPKMNSWMRAGGFLTHIFFWKNLSYFFFENCWNSWHFLPTDSAGFLWVNCSHQFYMEREPCRNVWIYWYFD